MLLDGYFPVTAEGLNVVGFSSSNEIDLDILIKRAMLSGRLRQENVTPAEWLDFLASKNIPVGADLVEAVGRFHPSFSAVTAPDAQSLAAMRAESDALAAEVERLRSLVGTMPADGEGVTVTLPHMTKALEAIFAVMRETWTTYDSSRMPKQGGIATAIDKAVGWSGCGNGDPSRNGKTCALIIKPDAVSDTE